MKKIRIILIVFVAASAILSCKKLAKALFTGTDVNAPDITITIPIIPVTGSEVSLGTYTAHYNLDSTVRIKTGGLFGASDVKSIKLKTVTITNTNADALNDLSNFEYVKVTLQSDNNPTLLNLLTINFPATPASTLTVNPADSPELLSYLSGTSVTYNVYGKNRTITTKPLNFVVSIVVRVN